MGDPTLRLDADDLCAMMADFGPPDVVAEDLLAFDDKTTPARPRKAQWPPVTLEGDLALVRDEESGLRCVLPASALRACRTAALAVMAARFLLSPGVVTVSLVGSGTTARIHLLVAVHGLPDISHLAMYRPRPTDAPPVTPRVAELLSRAGIGLSVTTRVRDATFGANLVILTGPGLPAEGLGHLAPGAVVINATGEHPPPALAGRASALFVDDPGRLELPGRTALATSSPIHLRQVFRGEHPGRSLPDQVLLVDLLTITLLDGSLARRLHRTALRHGRGEVVPG
ncbi:hypothetical protein [Streptomyces alkaliphilus]|nr:hypothetical protein [Streptomyces alkaliphilus]